MEVEEEGSASAGNTNGIPDSGIDVVNDAVDEFGMEGEVTATP